MEYYNRIHPDNKQDYFTLMLILDRLDHIEGNPRLKVLAKGAVHNILDNMTTKQIKMFGDIVEEEIPLWIDV